MTSSACLSPTRPSGYAAQPAYRIELLRRPNRVAARSGVRRLASSAHAIVADEQDHALVACFPRADADVAARVPLAERSNRCPFKGGANCWALAEAPGEPIAWSCPAPYPEVAAIAGHVTFYQDKVKVLVGAKAGWKR